VVERNDGIDGNLALVGGGGGRRRRRGRLLGRERDVLERFGVKIKLGPLTLGLGLAQKVRLERAQRRMELTMMVRLVDAAKERRRRRRRRRSAGNTTQIGRIGANAALDHGVLRKTTTRKGGSCTTNKPSVCIDQVGCLDQVHVAATTGVADHDCGRGRGQVWTGLWVGGKTLVML
jgi:hypothetical protein